jgi:energy-coupling factor transport system permease protein
VLASGLAAAVVVIGCAQQGLPGIVPPTSPAAVPALPWQAVAGVLVAAVPAWVAPEPPHRAALRTAPTRPPALGAAR